MASPELCVCAQRERERTKSYQLGKLGRTLDLSLALLDFRSRALSLARYLLTVLEGLRGQEFREGTRADLVVSLDDKGVASVRSQTRQPQLGAALLAVPGHRREVERRV